MTSAPEVPPPPALTDSPPHLAASPPRAGPTTASTRTTAVMVGLLFLTATAAFIVANALNAGVLGRPDFLTGAAADTPALATGAVLVLGQFGVVGIAVLLSRSSNATVRPWPSPTSRWPRAGSSS